MPNKEQSQSARGTQLYLQTVFMLSTLAGCGIEQMDDKSVSNEGKLSQVSVSVFQRQQR